MKTVLDLQNLKIGYRSSRNGEKVVAENLNVKLRAGELVCLLGPNGAGKSTLLRTVAGMQPPLGGEILLEGANIHRIAARDLAKKLSVVLTERITIGTLSAYALVALGRYPHTNWTGNLTENDYRIIAESLKIVGAADLANRNIGELSDGERQKVMVARALAQEPEVLILDEITAFLDLPRRVEMMQMLRRLAHEAGKSVLLSSHDLDLALRSADSVWLMERGGKLHTGAPEDLVLRGTFGQTFAGEGVSFNDINGEFEIARQIRGEINLTGAGKGETWTRRALEREGFTVLRNGAEDKSILRVEVVDGDAKQTLWKLSENENTLGFDSLQSLVAALKTTNRNSSEATKG